MQQLISWFWRKMSALKQMTDGSSVRVFTLILCGVGTAVWLTLSPCARVQANNVSDFTSEYPYVLWCPEYQLLALSKSVPSTQFINNSNYGYLYDPYNNAKVQIGARYYHFLGSDHGYGNTVILHYIPDLDTWDLSLPFQAESKSGDDILIGYESTYTYSSSDLEKKTVYTNGWSPAQINGYHTFIVNTSLPSNIPDINIGMPDISLEINNILNSSTTTSTQAENIQSIVNIAMDQYNQGNISSNDMQNVIDTLSSSLDSLSAQSGNTLSDQIAINNAQNAVQIAQDKVISQGLIDEIKSLFQLSETLSSEFISITELEQFIRESYIDPYMNGTYTKNGVLIGGENEFLPGLITLKSSAISALYGVASTEADYEYIAQMSSLIDKSIDIINNAGDVNKDVADKLESSDNEELEYLDSAISETTKDIDGLKSDLDNVISNSQANQVKTGILQPILNNKLIKSLLPIAALFMVLAVTLGVRYRL